MSGFWDTYVEEWKGDGLPGDEWGTPPAWSAFYQRFFAGSESWKQAVEIGPGSGKYTAKVLGNPDVQVRGYDVSAKFLEVCRRRLPSDRLDLRQLDTSTPAFLLDDLADWKRQVDAIYSIGVFVHIDLLYLMPYLITAGAVLKPEGKLIATFGNPTTEMGFQRLLEEIKPFWNDPGGKYEWLGRCVVKSLLPRLGFEIETLHQSNGAINVTLVASLARPEIGDDLTRYLR
jgi:SAM-dependent methyltransferase